MKFVNKGEPVQVRESDGVGRFKWKIVKTGESIDLPLKVGKAYGFSLKVKATEIQFGKTKAETKQIAEPKKEEYKLALTNIKGIGNKTAEDIIKVYPDPLMLRREIKDNKDLPFRDDIVKLLKNFSWETD